MLRLFADECAPGPVIRALRASGIAISLPLLGVDDLTVLQAAFVADSVILTRDKDFAKLVLHDRHPCHGLVVLRFSGPGSWAERASLILATIETLGEKTRGHITEISPTGATQTPIP